jgi:glycine dehydrogenase subunit 2
VGVILKAYAYIRSLGYEGLKEVSENAVLAANYIMQKLKPFYYFLMFLNFLLREKN